MAAPVVLHLSHSQSMDLAAPPEAVFPLLCPVRETEWLRGWEARLMYPAGGVAEQGCVFTTPGRWGSDWVWVISRHDAPRSVQFIIHAPNSHVTELDIRLETGPRGTRATWTYTLTALDPGKEAAHREYMCGLPARLADLEVRLNHFLRTGACL